MGGFFGITSSKDCVKDVYFGTDYHSHLGMHCGGMAVYDESVGLQREIHNIENSPFRTKFERVFNEIKGTSAIGCISDSDPQPLLIRSRLGAYALAVTGIINNRDELIKRHLEGGGYFDAMTGGDVNNVQLVAALINGKNDFAEGIKFAQREISGTASILIMTDDGSLIAARDRMGRIPVILGKNKNGYCVSFEAFAYRKLGYSDEKELGPGEVLRITPNGYEQLSAPGKEMRICSFLWTYYGYPTSAYEGVNVEIMRMKNGELLAEQDIASGTAADIDYVGGVPDSGTPHAIGYANKSRIPFARPYIKYTPTWSRSFTPADQSDRNKIAKMKQIPVRELIRGKKLLFVDDSIVRGTQLKETVEFLYNNGAQAVHMRSACPPIMYGCKYLNFSRVTGDFELITRRVIVELEGEEGLNHIDEYSNSDTERGKNLREAICKKFNFTSLEFQSLDNLVKAIGIDKCKLCTYCWNGKE
ncbi:MAG: amidophosphoribosyltransferase [Clostridia bacterium]|nr:amidophosphoribosyltransferase [Clostridia bacterium]